MPNWCENQLEVRGPEKSMEKFQKESKGKKHDLTMKSTIPMPDYIYQGDLGEQEQKQYGENNWYDWSRNNWGTKWDVEGTLIYQDNNRLEYEFLSAWAPPTVWLQKVSRLFPDLYFELKYVEEGMDFSGIAMANNGELMDQED
jgi:hypothetical protein